MRRGECEEGYRRRRQKKRDCVYVAVEHDLIIPRFLGARSDWFAGRRGANGREASQFVTYHSESRPQQPFIQHISWTAVREGQPQFLHVSKAFGRISCSATDLETGWFIMYSRYTQIPFSEGRILGIGEQKIPQASCLSAAHDRDLNAMLGLF